MKAGSPAASSAAPRTANGAAAPATASSCRPPRSSQATTASYCPRRMGSKPPRAAKPSPTRKRCPAPTGNIGAAIAPTALGAAFSRRSRPSERGQRTQAAHAARASSATAMKRNRTETGLCPFGNHSPKSAIEGAGMRPGAFFPGVSYVAMHKLNTIEAKSRRLGGMGNLGGPIQ